MDKLKYMQTALKLAQTAAQKDEVPVGAVIVDSESGKIVAKAYNQSAHNGDCTCHAEILAIRKACKKLKQTRLWGLDMYVTLEPCTMCAAAISMARIRKLYFAADDIKGGAVVNGVKFYDSHTCHHKPETEHGLLADESSALLKEFFKQKR